MQEQPHAARHPHPRPEKCSRYFAKLYPDYFIWMSFGISLRKLEMRDEEEGRRGFSAAGYRLKLFIM